jgi:RHS repeat-associated protein
LEYNGTKYAYVKNLQGDVIRIINGNGATVVEYTYDAWGNILSVTGSMASTLGATNPFRYRGYYYDTESGWYYLNSRYYDPQVGRFINADGIIGANGGIMGYNMFAYCNNNPVMHSDPTGYSTPRYSMSPDMYGAPRYVQMPFFSGGGGGGAAYITRIQAPNIYVASCDEDELSFVLYDSDRFEDKNAFYEQLIILKADALKFGLKEGDLLLFQTEADFYTAGYEFGWLDIALFDIGHAEFALGLENWKFDAKALVSAYSPSIKVSVFGLFSIELGVEVLAAGFSLEGSWHSGIYATIAVGLGVHVGFSWGSKTNE